MGERSGELAGGPGGYVACRGGQGPDKCDRNNDPSLDMECLGCWFYCPNFVRLILAAQIDLAAHLGARDRAQ
jgi:hypothetical protein